MKKILFASLIFIAFGCSDQDLIRPAKKHNNPLLSGTDLLVHDIYSKYADGLNTVGVSISMLIGDSMYHYGYGETNIGSRKVPDENTFYEIGSITKVFTAIATLKMLDQAGLDIEAPIRSFLPADLPTLNRNGIEVNFKHLLTHTSGLPYMPTNLGANFYFNVVKGWENYSEQDLYSCLYNVRLASDPFTKFEYSNTGMGTLGVMLGRYYNKDYRKVMEQEILEPMMLLDTSPYFEKTDPNRWAKGHQNGKEVAYWKTINAINGAGVLKGTSADLLRFAKLCINPEGHPLEDYIERSQVLTFNKATDYEFFVVRNGLGWFFYENKGLPGKTFLYHSGGTGGFNSELFISKAHRSALVILFNTDGITEERELMIQELLRVITGISKAED